MKKFWWNFRKNTYDIGSEKREFRDEDARKYIPNCYFAIAAYDKFRKNNKSVSESMYLVLQMFKKV